MTCKKGGFVCIRHDEVRDLTASMLKEVWPRRPPPTPTLLPLDGELLRYRTAKYRPGGSRGHLCSGILDQRAGGPFWTSGSSTRWPPPIVSFPRGVHHRNELEKKRGPMAKDPASRPWYLQPLVFTTSGGMAPKARSFYSRLAT
ncbi:hypothetical protein GWK47_022258 [Chionoecetes opilio]|uniref:Uncharacterized protein n=1 Tax=Chionoecetes opilio TaxID=41210 RepID=A0A8J4XNR4_CHIOP|nr:hypothetical protein GWK47_022258 [Chionoecetes opilio]